MGCLNLKLVESLDHKIMIEQYNKIKKLKNFNLKSEPKPFKHTINSNDIKRGYITRYFVQKTNDSQTPIIEVSNSNYTVMTKNPLLNQRNLNGELMVQ